MTEQCENNRIRLGHLQQTMKDHLINLSDYAIALNALQHQSRTLTINLENYHSLLFSSPFLIALLYRLIAHWRRR